MDLQTSLDLKDRTLWFDGESSMSSERIAEMILSGKDVTKIHPLEMDASVKKYNMYTDNNLTLKDDVRITQPEFSLPEKYISMDLKKYILGKLREHVETHNYTATEIEKRIDRVKLELSLFKEYNIVDLIKSTIYIIDRFEDNGIIWGTGRGSSCACYCLYLIGLHEVDSVLYDLDLNEFFR